MPQRHTGRHQQRKGMETNWKRIIVSDITDWRLLIQYTTHMNEVTSGNMMFISNFVLICSWFQNLLQQRQVHEHNSTISLSILCLNDDIFNSSECTVPTTMMISKPNQKHVEGISHSLLSGTGQVQASKDCGRTQKNLSLDRRSLGWNFNLRSSWSEAVVLILP